MVPISKTFFVYYSYLELEPFTEDLIKADTSSLLHKLEKDHESFIVLSVLVFFFKFFVCSFFFFQLFFFFFFFFLFPCASSKPCRSLPIGSFLNSFFTYLLVG